MAWEMRTIVIFEEKGERKWKDRYIYMLKTGRGMEEGEFRMKMEEYLDNTRSIEAILKLSSTYWPPLQRILADFDSWHWGWCRFDVHTWLCESSSPSLQGSDRQQSTWKTTSAVWLQAQQHIKDRNKYKKLIMHMCTMYCHTYHLGFVLPIRKQFK